MLRFFALYRAALQPSRCSVTLCLAVSTVARGGLLPDVIIPSDSADADAIDISRLPFGYVCPQVVHYQQVYNAAAFSSVRPPGAFLTAIFFRGDCSASWVPVVTNLQVNLSITSKAADQLSALFAENPGADETVVGTPIVQTRQRRSGAPRTVIAKQGSTAPSTAMRPLRGDWIFRGRKWNTLDIR